MSATGCHVDVIPPHAPELAGEPYTVGPVLVEDDFRHGTGNLLVESEQGGRVEAKDGTLTIDVPRGCTVWLTTLMEGEVMIEYTITAVSAGGPNDRVSDVNCFWMARDARNPDVLFGQKRSGAFVDYNMLRAYYVGHGGNQNTTTRFRRYIGDPELRPLLPEHDLRTPDVLLKPNEPIRVRLVACGGLVQYFADGRKLFELHDAEPYRSGWFGWRTVNSHLQVRDFRVYRLYRRGG
jgi:hypothetical protein